MHPTVFLNNKHTSVEFSAYFTPFCSSHLDTIGTVRGHLRKLLTILLNDKFK